MLSDTNARLEMKRDVGGQHLQWFSFHCFSSADMAHVFDIINAGGPTM